MKRKIAELELSDSQKRLLTILSTPRDTSEVSGRMNWSYDYTRKELKRLLHSPDHYIIISTTMKGRIIYKLNTDEYEV